MRQLPRMAAMVCLAMLLALPAIADVVYLKNGKKVKGNATRSGDKVVVQTQNGVREFAADEVLYISKTRTDSDGSGDDSGGDWEKTSSDDSSGDSSTDADKPDKSADLKPVNSPVRKNKFRITDATQPEPVVFSLMRALEATEVGGASADLKTQIAAWQRKTKDRQRRLESRWAEPKDIVLMRSLYQKRLAEAEEQFDLAGQVGRRDRNHKAKAARFRQAGMEKLKLAAAAWADPGLRYWLQGVASHKDEQYGAAQTFFSRAVKENPRVAAFWQGLGMAELAAEEPINATDAFLKMLRFRPEDRMALQMTRDAVKKIPGSALKNEVYLKAREVLEGYDAPEYRRRRDYWMLPGKHVSDREENLPTPEYDRLIRRQAVGVALSSGALIVDHSVLKDAAEVFVRIDETTVVPAEMKRVSIFRGRGPSVPLGLITVPGYEFTPAAYSEDADFSVGEVVTAFGLETYEEMGDQAYPIRGRITAVDANGASVDVRLAPGDSGSVVLTEDKRVVGFLAGRTDALAKGGGENVFFTAVQAEDILDKAQRSRPDRYSMIKGDPVKVDKSTAVVYTLIPETFKE